MKTYYKVNQSKYDIRFRYWRDERGVYGRDTRLWWKPMKKLGYLLQKINYWYYQDQFAYGTFHWWIRKHLTFD